MTKPRNKIWLFNDYRSDDTLIGELEGTSEMHALEEFSYEYPDDHCHRVERVKGSGQPYGPKPQPMPGTKLYRVRYKLVRDKMTLARKQKQVRTISLEHAANLFNQPTNDKEYGVCDRIATSVKQVR